MVGLASGVSSWAYCRVGATSAPWALKGTETSFLAVAQDLGSFDANLAHRIGILLSLLSNYTFKKIYIYDF